ncbi:MAG: 2-oxoacid:acceptor oxidoreductase family protein [Clostridia bacterium]|nr:2-oxoacid:acceptor oxidoreductase family protein [Clostridia bacterium]
MTHELIFAGFGGQGILFAGKLLAYAAMMGEKEVSWLPSYGPEMRGGTANCHVIVSESPVSSPLVTTPTILAAMNKPSFEKFEQAVKPGGIIVKDSTLIDSKTKREDITCFDLPATKIAMDLEADKLANMVMTGKIIKESGILPMDLVLKALEKMIPPKKQHLVEINKKVLLAGYEF